MTWNCIPDEVYNLLESKEITALSDDNQDTVSDENEPIELDKEVDAKAEQAQQ